MSREPLRPPHLCNDKRPLTTFRQRAATASLIDPKLYASRCFQIRRHFVIVVCNAVLDCIEFSYKRAAMASFTRSKRFFGFWTRGHRIVVIHGFWPSLGRSEVSCHIFVFFRCTIRQMLRRRVLRLFVQLYFSNLSELHVDGVCVLSSNWGHLFGCQEGAMRLYIDGNHIFGLPATLPSSNVSAAEGAQKGFREPPCRLSHDGQ